MGAIGFLIAYGLGVFVTGLFVVHIVQTAWRYFVKREPDTPVRPWGSDSGSTPGYE